MEDEMSFVQVKKIVTPGGERHPTEDADRDSDAEPDETSLVQDSVEKEEAHQEEHEEADERKAIQNRDADQYVAPRALVSRRHNSRNFGVTIENPDPIIWMDLTTRGVTCDTTDGNSNKAENAINPTVSSCYQSKSEKNPYLQVNLGSKRLLRAVEITTPPDVPIVNGEVKLDGTVCASSVNIEGGETKEVACAAEGKKVRVEINRNNEVLGVCLLRVSLDPDDDDAEDIVEEISDLSAADEDEEASKAEDQADEAADREEGCDFGGSNGETCADGSTEPEDPFTPSETGKGNQKLVSSTGSVEFGSMGDDEAEKAYKAKWKAVDALRRKHPSDGGIPPAM